VSSSWQTAPPHPIYVSHGRGSRITDIDGNEFIDFHNGYGAMVVGHAHPKIVEAVQRRIALGSHFAQPTEDALVVADDLATRTGLPLWRFGNSGTEATLDAVRLMRAATGRDRVIKIEGTYHGHHDALMVSVFPEAPDWGPPERPRSLPQTPGLPRSYVDLTVVVPFGDLQAAQLAFEGHPGAIAGIIVEPAMTNVGLVLPPDGWLLGLRELCRANRAFLAFDEVKTGATLDWAGAIGAFGVRPDIACFAKAIGGGLPCGAIGGIPELMGLVERGRVDQVGTFNGNPLTMAASRAALTEVLVPEAYERFGSLNRILGDGVGRVIAAHRLPAHLETLGAKGSITWRRGPIRSYRDAADIDHRPSYLSWLWQLNRGVFKSPWAKWESWTTSVVHDDDDAHRYVENFESLADALTS
jgi:glutamate-1-semialdehyde 2,1-aminomutase